MRVLILGVTGMAGSVVFKTLTADSRYDVRGTLRDEAGRRFFAEPIRERLECNIDVLNRAALTALMNRVRPEVVINCIGVVKQLPSANDPLIVLPINAMLPHQLAGMCGASGARLIHFSTDCVYSGRRGDYKESDPTDAEDLYGKSKAIGEPLGYSHVLVLRTSLLGHELNSKIGLLEWFLAQQGRVQGFSRAIFSGLPAVEFARVVRDFVLPSTEMCGLYHVSAKPIAKLDVLKLIANVYGKNIVIAVDDTFAVDRSLNSQRFTEVTGYVAAEWPELISLMHRSRQND